MSTRQIPDIEPGTPQWMAKMSASKIPAVVGLSPWESRRSLWEKMSGNVGEEEQTAVQARGHYLEDGIARWWADQHPGVWVEPGGTWERTDLDWAIASPDRCVWLPQGDTVAAVVYEADGTLPPPPALVEVKTSADDTEWGTPGTDQIPPSYRPQVVWQMLITGARTVFVAVLTSRLEFREYRVDWDAEVAADAEWLRCEADEFMTSLMFGEAPDLDGDDATYQTLRKTHPLIDGEDIDLTREEAAAFVAGREQFTAGERAYNLARAQMTELMGTAKRARYGKQTIAIRKAKGTDGVPWVEPGRGLPSLDSLTTSADEEVSR